MRRLLLAIAIATLAFDAHSAAPLVVCASAAGERKACAADTTAGIRLLRSLGPGACELGRTWGFDEAGVWVSEGCSGEFAAALAETPKKYGRYEPTRGFKVADTEHGDLNIRLFTYVRYLNQREIDDTYTNAFGQTRTVQQRQDFQVNKAQVYFYGWILSPKLRYLAYIWTSNASQGQSASVVVAGNVNYTINEHVTVGGGIGGLPGTRSLEGNFPYWLPVDYRQIGDEFFRPSYTTGLWVNGKILPGLTYDFMIGNNLSQLGVDAGQLDNSLDTFSGGLVFRPTTGEYGPNGGYGDFEDHQEAATRFGIHFTESDENRQSQPDTDAFENVQIRVSDGSVIFTADLFGPGIQIDDARYRMLSFDAGLKYRGFSVEGEYYRRWVDDFRGPGVAGLPFDQLNDDGFQLIASAMLRPRSLQVYAGGSKVFGEYGDPWDARVGVNWFPWKNQVVRWNFEIMQLRRSPVGAFSLPYVVGANGPIWHSNFMLWF